MAAESIQIPPLSEADVQAFTDGLLEPDRAEQVRQYLAGQPEEARRVAFYNQLNRQIQTAFSSDGELNSALFTCPAVIRATRLSWLRQRAWIIATVLAVPLAGAICMALTLGVAEPTLEGVAIAALEQASDSGSAAYRHPAADRFAGAPNLSGAGLYATGRFTAWPAPWSPATGFVYRNAAGDAVVLVRATGRGAPVEGQWSARRVGTKRLLYWSNGRSRYVMTGEARTRGLMRAADLLVSR
jgi:hypothetical protein